MALPRHRLRRTPATPNTSQQAFGAALLAPPSRRWSTGVVMDFDPNTQRYRLSIDGVGLNDTVPRLARDPGDLLVLPAETVVVVHDELGYWVIDSVLKQASITPSRIPPPTITEIRGVGGEDPVRAPAFDGPTHRASTDPVDMLAGDWVRRSPDGNLMGVLAGGVNTMQSSPFAAVRTHALEELVEILAHKYRHISAMGNLEIKSEDGKTSLVWRAGADQSNENGPDRENWTIRLDVGATGDLFDFAVTSPDGQALARIHMSSEGKLQLLGVDGVDIISGGSTASTARDVSLSSKTVVVKGDAAFDVARNHTTAVGGSRVTEISGNDSTMTGTDRNEVIGRDVNSTVNGRLRQTVVGGSPLTAQPGVAALELEVLNGGVTYILGDMAKGASPAAMPDFNVINHTGGINLALLPTSLGSFSVVSQRPGSVNLGADGMSGQNPLTGGPLVLPVPAPFGVMKFEPFATLMVALITWLDTHFHLCAVGPTLPPTVPSSTILPLMVPDIRSVRVSVGL